MFFHPLFAVSFALLFLFFSFCNSNNAKRVALLIFSIGFYFFVSSSLGAVLILASQSIITYFLSKKVKDNKLVLLIGIILLLIPLIIFKYKYFWLRNFNLEIDLLDGITIVGVSFFTFQSLSFLIDSYKGVFVQTGFIDTLNEIMFFPTVLSGPISSPNDLNGQFNNLGIKDDLYKLGLYRIFVGVVQKLFFASYLGIFVDSNISNLNDLNLLSTYICFFAYTAQIYFDFAGYSNLVIGLANLLGFKIMDNFNSPYLSLSIKDFWNKWHISLSSFFKKYIYISLGGNRLGLFRNCCNVLIVMFICGVWHGSTLNYIYWGLYNGFLLALIAILNTKFKDDEYSKITKFIFWFLNIHLIMFGWIFFRLEQETDYLSLLNAIKNLELSMLNFSNINIYFIIGIVVFCFISQIKYLKDKLLSFYLKNNLFVSTITIAFLLLFVLYISPEGIPNFIYFKY